MLAANIWRSRFPSHKWRRSNRQVQRASPRLRIVHRRRSVLGRRQALRWAIAGNDNRALFANRAKGFDLILVPNYLHVVMLAEPGWVIPAGRYERRYAALSVSDRRREDREYFRALHRQIANGGAEAMMW